MKQKAAALKPRRKKTNIACVNCSRSHVTCESVRPCSRCVRKGLEHTCVNAPRKRRKYLADVPEDQLPITLKPSSLDDDSLDEDRESSGALTVISDAPEGTLDLVQREQEHQFEVQGKIVHKTKFLSSAANLEYSTLSDIIRQDSLFSKVPVSLLYNGTDSPTPPSDSLTSPQGKYILAQQQQQQHQQHQQQQQHLRPVLQKPIIRPGFTADVLNGRSAFHNLLGPHTEEILRSNIDLFKVHIPLVPVEDIHSYSNYKQRLSSCSVSSSLRCEKSLNQYYLSSECTLPEVVDLAKLPTCGDRYLSFALENKAPDEHQTLEHPEWSHSLRYSTPMEIYTLITEPFCHTSGFHSLLKYLHSRFKRRDLVEMCRSIAEFRPIFIASAIDLTEEDMIFMEQSYQRTLLEYDKFIAQIGTPTCVWRRNGQISYLNDEFSVFTGWAREELLGKMTFIVELMDDASVRQYFKTFSQVAYKDFKGFERMESCTLLTPILGKTIDCVCMWTWKRDVFGMPMMIVGHFLPILFAAEDRKPTTYRTDN